MDCYFKQQRFENDGVPKRVFLHDVDGYYFQNFKDVMDDLAFKLRNEHFENKSIIISIDGIAENHKKIDRWNIKWIISEIEKAHKLSKTELSLKWLRFLKRYRKQFD